MRSKRIIQFIPLLVLFPLLIWLMLPPLENGLPTPSTVLYDSSGILIAAKIAPDQQWRIAGEDTVREKFKKAILEFEDRHFYFHPGFNPISLIKSAYINFKKGRIARGGSTLSMQVVRLYHKSHHRTFFSKFLEIFLAMRLELHYSKEEILSLYAALAPFGGNIVGLEGASLKYYGRSASDLTWGEAALLAVIPNAPSWIFPGKNQEKLIKKRNDLLKRLLNNQVIDRETYELALLEPLPNKPFPFPKYASHLLETSLKQNPGNHFIKTTIDSRLQKNILNILERHAQRWEQNEIYNGAILIAETNTGKIVAYAGNLSRQIQGKGRSVDIIQSPRSTGSILKPFLYAAMMQDGSILPRTLVADIPTSIAGYAPENFDKTYTGAVPANQALVRSLNIPSVILLREHSIDRFLNLLKNTGFKNLDKPASHYGLSLILGGGEASLWEIVQGYLRMAETINQYRGSGTIYKFQPMTYLKTNEKKITGIPAMDAGSSWLTIDALVEVTRPGDEIAWDSFSGSQKIGWKTGTSYGFRDGWAVGVSKDHVVGVWVGNATGEGRPGLTGVQAAAPVLFDVFSQLPDCEWFDPPFDELKHVPVCRQSGYRPGQNCIETDSIYIHQAGLKTTSCPYHKLVHLNHTGKNRVQMECFPEGNIKDTSWFILPPIMEYYFKKNSANYAPLPPLAKGCNEEAIPNQMALIYPQENGNVYIPVQLDGNKGELVFEAAHRRNAATIYWYLNERFLGTTKGNHKMNFYSAPGKYKLMLMDEMGSIIERKINILDRQR